MLTCNTINLDPRYQYTQVLSFTIYMIKSKSIHRVNAINTINPDANAQISPYLSLNQFIISESESIHRVLVSQWPGVWLSADESDAGFYSLYCCIHVDISHDGVCKRVIPLTQISITSTQSLYFLLFYFSPSESIHHTVTVNSNNKRLTNWTCKNNMITMHTILQN